MKREHIYVGIPCGWTVTFALAMMLHKLGELNGEDCPYRFTVRMLPNVHPADYARNSIVREFLATDATRLWFIDSDIIPAPNSIQILRWKADIVGGLYPIWGQVSKDDAPAPQFAVYNYNEPAGAYNPQMVMDQGVVPCDALGTGMMVIRREVLEDPAMRYAPEFTSFTDRQMRLKDDEPPAIFRENHKPNGQFDATEDIDFCYRAAQCGYTMLADHGVKCGHVKTANVMSIINYTVNRVETLIDQARTAAMEKRVVLAS